MTYLCDTITNRASLLLLSVQWLCSYKITNGWWRTQWNTFIHAYNFRLECLHFHLIWIWSSKILKIDLGGASLNEIQLAFSNRVSKSRSRKMDLLNYHIALKSVHAHLSACIFDALKYVSIYYIIELYRYMHLYLQKGHAL